MKNNHYYGFFDIENVGLCKVLLAGFVDKAFFV